MPTIPENTTAWLTITFKDRNGNNEAPTSFRYRIDTSLGTGVKGWETVSSPSATHEITIAASDNDFKQRSNSDIQQNIVTVEAEFGVNDTRSEIYTYLIRKLENI